MLHASNGQDNCVECTTFLWYWIMQKSLPVYESFKKCINSEYGNHTILSNCKFYFHCRQPLRSLMMPAIAVIPCNFKKNCKIRMILFLKKYSSFYFTQEKINIFMLSSFFCKNFINISWKYHPNLLNLNYGTIFSRDIYETFAKKAWEQGFFLEEIL